MFDPCIACRRRLAKRAEGKLPRSQWARLEAHLSQCASCRRIDEADRALHMALSMGMMSTERISYDAAEAFDSRVIAMARSRPEQGWLARFIGWLLAGARGSAMLFTQIAGGALVAATVTAACLWFAVQPRPVMVKSSVVVSTHQTRNERWLHGPPAPLESLMDTPAPRAALLWTAPSHEDREAASTAKPDPHNNSF